MLAILKILVYAAQGLALLAAIKYWHFYKESTQKYFFPFMIYVILNEFIGNYFEVITGMKDFCLYNTYSLICLAFFHFWFYTIIAQKAICRVLSLLFLAGAAASIGLESFTDSLWTYILYIGVLNLIILSVFYYSNLLRSNKSIIYFKTPNFWFTTGIFIFYLGFSPVIFFQELISQDRIDYRVVLAILNIILYGSFTLGFVNTKNG